MIAEWYTVDGQALDSLSPIQIETKSLAEAAKQMQKKFKMAVKLMSFNFCVLEDGKRRLVVSEVHE